MKKQKKAIIIGAGPAGLTAAYELITKTNVIPIIYEQSNMIGGISRTENYKGNRIDIGGHRFFSKSDIIMNWWKNIFPYEDKNNSKLNSTKTDKLMLKRNRKSRIYYLKKFFDYPITISMQTIKNLGIIKILKIGFSYIYTKIFPKKNENSLEEFFINRFGNELYKTFFKDYTEKLWGISCKKISPEWGAQRIKGLSITKALINAITSKFRKSDNIKQKNIETSLIETFLYPKYGPGQLWDEVARIIKNKGGKIYLNHDVIGIKKYNNEIKSVEIKNNKTEKRINLNGDYFFSTMPVKDLIKSFNKKPKEIESVAKNLCYRDFITVGILLKKLNVKEQNKIKTRIKDTWIYVQENYVKLGRIQFFNNWSPYLAKDNKNIWIGLEYFCSEGDKLWSMEKSKFIKFAINELEVIGVAKKEDVIDSTIIKTKKAYPSYFGSYKDINKIFQFTNKIENLFLIGRNGMHRYNNQDHSMLTAIESVDNIINNRKDKSNIWSVNTEKEYHEKK